MIIYMDITTQYLVQSGYWNQEDFQNTVNRGEVKTTKDRNTYLKIVNKGLEPLTIIYSILTLNNFKSG